MGDAVDLSLAGAYILEKAIDTVDRLKQVEITTSENSKGIAKLEKAFQTERTAPPPCPPRFTEAPFMSSEQSNTVLRKDVIKLTNDVSEVNKSVNKLASKSSARHSSTRQAANLASANVRFQIAASEKKVLGALEKEVQEVQKEVQEVKKEVQEVKKEVKERMGALEKQFEALTTMIGRAFKIPLDL
jgi:DNA repair exonuclease SbcCD ATPase subunit